MTDERVGNFTITHDEHNRRVAKQVVADSNGQLGLCERCGGTGNELYSMYRKCSDCDGIGVDELVEKENSDGS